MNLQVLSFILMFNTNTNRMRRLRAQMMFDEDEQVQNKQPETIKKTGHIKSKQWVKLFQSNKCHKLKAHILNFFLSQGHFDLAKSFSQQSGISLPNTVSQQNIRKRYQVKQLIQKGQIDEAIQKIQQLNKELFEQKQNVQLLFSLKGLKVINLIKNQKLQEAIATARKELLPFAKQKQNQSYMQKIQEIMSLLAFSDMKQCESYELTTLQYRNSISTQVNQLLLNRKKNNKNQTLIQLIKLGKWFQKRLDKYVQFPRFNISSNQNIFSTE